MSPSKPQLMTTPMSRRTLLGALGLAGGAAILAACAPSAPSGGPSSASTATTGTRAENFSFASWSLSEEAPKAVIEAQLAAFQGANDITVAPVTYPFAEYLNQLTLQTRGGQFSGAAQLDIAWLATLAALGKLVDLSGLAQGRGYTEAGLNASKVDGVQYGLPWTLGAIGLVANQEILGRVGADDVPETIDEFTNLLRELKGLGDGLIPYAASTKVAQLKDVQIWMQTFGSPLLENGKVTIGDDASVEAVTWYKTLYDEGLIAADVDRFDARSLFSQGRTAMYDDAPVGRSAVTNESPITNLADLLVPCARPVLNAGDTARALAWGHTVVVVDGDGSGTAGEFAQWLTSDPETVVGYFTDLGLPPATTEQAVTDAVAQDAFIAAFAEKITADATPSPFWVYPQYGQIDTVINEKVQAAIVGQTPVATALAEARDAAQALIQ